MINRLPAWPDGQASYLAVTLAWTF